MSSSMAISTSKILKIKVSEILYDATSLTLPFVNEYRLKDKETGEKKYITAITFERDVVRDGIPCVTQLNVRGDGRLGIPTQKTQEVMIGIERMFVAKHTVNGELRLKTDMSDVTEEDRTIDVGSINNLARAMGYKGNINNRVRQSILDDLDRLEYTHWESVTGWHVTDDDKNKRFYESLKKGFTLISRPLTLERRDYDDKGNVNTGECLDASTRITISMEVYMAIASKQCVIYNENISDKIPNLPAKNVYLIGKKWAGKDKVLTIHTDKLEQVVPTIQKGKYKKRYIMDVLDKLKSTNTCKVTLLKNDVVVLDYRTSNKLCSSYNSTDTHQDDSAYFKSRYKKWSEAVKRLKEIGFTSEEIDDIDVDRIKYICALLRYIDTREYAGKKNGSLSIADIKGFFINYYNNNYEIDEKYY